MTRNPDSNLSTIDIITAIKDRRLLGSLPAFKSLKSWASWITWLKAAFCLPMTADELAVFQKCTSRDRPPSKESSEVFTIIGRRGGKSFMMAVVAVFLACFRSYSIYLATGETGMVLILARDREQAKVVFKYLRGILRAVPVLRKMIAAERADEIELRNGIVIAVKTADFRSLRGVTVVCAIGDEPCFWSNEGANPDKEIITALRPAMSTIPGAKLLLISSPYAKRGVMFDAYREHFGKDDDDALVWQADTRTMNPNISETMIAKEMEKDPDAARSEWLGLFREDLESAFALETIQACVVPGRAELPFGNDLNHRAFVDVSGGRHDDFTLAIGHPNPDLNYSTLDLIRAWRPPFDPSVVTKECAEILKSYRVQEVIGDQYGGEWPVSEFRKHEITYTPSPKNKSDLYLGLIPIICGRKIRLLDHKQLAQQLQRLERRKGRSGKDSIDHGPGGRDDVANAVAGLAWVLDQATHYDAAQIEHFGKEASVIEEMDINGGFAFGIRDRSGDPWSLAEAGVQQFKTWSPSQWRG